MQKFVVKKISRSTNVTIGAAEQSLPADQEKPEGLEISSVKMSGYLKKKRNRVGGWSKLYFVLQNNLLMSYNSKEEYENHLVSFKDVVCLIPGATVLLPSLEPRFTIGSNLNTFYTFRCDDNKICSKWVTAIVECLSRDDMDLDRGTKKQSSPPRNFLSQQNLSSRLKTNCNDKNHSWESLPRSNWFAANHNGRILLELNYINCNRAKLPIEPKTAKLLQNCTNSDVVTTTKKINFIQSDENENLIRNSAELRADKDGDQFRLHNGCRGNGEQAQSRIVDQISKMFVTKSESQRPESLTQCNGNDKSEIGMEVQMQMLSFGEETGDYSSMINYQSVDSKKFNNKLSIEEIDSEGNFEPEYAVIDIQKKREGRLQKMLNEAKDVVIYEDVGAEAKANNEENIYELIDIPLRPSRKSRSLVWKNWSRMHIFDFTKRFKETPEDSRKPPSPATISKRHKASLTLSHFSKRFNYQSIRSKARRMCSRKNSTLVSSGCSETNSEKIV